ncbi:MAG: hypothetical protein GXP27_18715 [Planctomycetes bacterium]|nr:hypothetical protein [Planctomycetota bacterium]
MEAINGPEVLRAGCLQALTRPTWDGPVPAPLCYGKGKRDDSIEWSGVSN